MQTYRQTYDVLKHVSDPVNVFIAQSPGAQANCLAVSNRYAMAVNSLVA